MSEPLPDNTEALLLTTTFDPDDAAARRAELLEKVRGADNSEKEITRLRAELERARTALLDANSICRSAFAIAHHVAVEHGTAELGTFFGRFSERAHESLKRQHDAILATGGYPITQEPPA